jgi:hypothetical protein
MQASRVIAILIILIALLAFFVADGRPCKEHMVTEAEMSTLSRGFNAPLAGDYAQLGTIYRAEQADKTSDYILTRD